MRANSDAYAEALLKYQTILTVQTFLRIFQQTTPLSKYLKTSGKDLLTAHRFVTSKHDNMKKYARDFKRVKAATDAFVQWANRELNVCETDTEVEHTLPNRRPKKTKRMPGELCDDTAISDADSKYEVQVHNVILDSIIESISRRFAKNRELYTDFALLDPQNFNGLKCNGVPAGAVSALSAKLIRLDSRATPEALQAELLSLATHWDKLK